MKTTNWKMLALSALIALGQGLCADSSVAAHSNESYCGFTIRNHSPQSLTLLHDQEAAAVSLELAGHDLSIAVSTDTPTTISLFGEGATEAPDQLVLELWARLASLFMLSPITGVGDVLIIESAEEDFALYFLEHDEDYNALTVYDLYVSQDLSAQTESLVRYRGFDLPDTRVHRLCEQPLHIHNLGGAVTPMGVHSHLTLSVGGCFLKSNVDYGPSAEELKQASLDLQQVNEILAECFYMDGFYGSKEIWVVDAEHVEQAPEPARAILAQTDLGLEEGEVFLVESDHQGSYTLSKGQPCGETFMLMDRLALGYLDEIL